ncbi:substrate-binding periplasmic protein [Pseudodesulfovibrio cashew]|nr:transporter substrate-binding domain-containing protein [Pseudodesulfovibrio cashew]
MRSASLRFVPVLWGLLFLLFAVDCQARTVRVGIGFAIPPYVIRESHAGIEVDVIRESLKAAGLEVEFVYLPNLRLPVEYAAGNVDGIATNTAYDLAGDSGRETYSSGTTIILQNYAVTLLTAEPVNSFDDMEDKRVLAFNNAVKYLGPDFGKMTKRNDRYSELADQSLQVRMLYSGRVDVVVADKRILLWWRDKLANSPLAQKLELKKPLRFNAVFPPSPRHVAFADPGLRDAFDRGLDTIRRSGLHAAILQRYLKSYAVK